MFTADGFFFLRYILWTRPGFWFNCLLHFNWTMLLICFGWIQEEHHYATFNLSVLIFYFVCRFLVCQAGHILVAFFWSAKTDVFFLPNQYLKHCFKKRSTQISLNFLTPKYNILTKICKDWSVITNIWLLAAVSSSLAPQRMSTSAGRKNIFPEEIKLEHFQNTLFSWLKKKKKIPPLQLQRQTTSRAFFILKVGHKHEIQAICNVAIYPPQAFSSLQPCEP